MRGPTLLAARLRPISAARARFYVFFQPSPALARSSPARTFLRARKCFCTSRRSPATRGVLRGGTRCGYDWMRRAPCTRLGATDGRSVSPPVSWCRRDSFTVIGGGGRPRGPPCSAPRPASSDNFLSSPPAGLCPGMASRAPGRGPATAGPAPRAPDGRPAGGSTRPREGGQITARVFAIGRTTTANRDGAPPAMLPSACPAFMTMRRGALLCRASMLFGRLTSCMRAKPPRTLRRL